MIAYMFQKYLENFTFQQFLILIKITLKIYFFFFFKKKKKRKVKVAYSFTISIFFLFINKTLRLNNVKPRAAMDVKIQRLLYALMRLYICYYINVWD